jgi:hypothetical protein
MAACDDIRTGHGGGVRPGPFLHGEKFFFKVSVKKQVGKDLAVFSRIDVFWKKECAGGT